VDLHEKRQIDLAEHMARVNQHVAKARTRARPWRSIISLILAVGAGSVAAIAGTQFKYWTGPANYTPKIIAAVSIAAFCVFGASAVVGLAAKTREVLTPAVGSSHAAVVRYAILLVGGVTLLVLTVSLCKVPIGQLLVGGAVTTILLGIAGQQALANIFAGLVLLLSRPFVVGDYVRVKSGALGGVTDGLVTEIGITYLRLETEDGPLNLPNSQVLAAATGPIPRPGDAPGGAPSQAAAGQGAPAQALPAQPPPGESPPDQVAAAADQEPGHDDRPRGESPSAPS
jgi:small-conductance mechanosensitive channel